MSKVLVVDYDKTFYLNDLDIKKNIKLVQKFRELNNIFIIATGRSYHDFLKKKEKYKIEYDYLLINHGATILDKNDNVLYNFPFSIDIEKIKSMLEIDKSIMYFCCSKLESRVDFDNPNLTKIAVRYLPFVNISKIKENIINTFPSINAYLVSSNMLEIISNKIDKSKAIKLVIELLNIDKNDVYTVGDSFTDINMVRDFNGYSMVKAESELKQYAIGEVESVSCLIKKLIKK